MLFSFIIDRTQLSAFEEGNADFQGKLLENTGEVLLENYYCKEILHRTSFQSWAW
jgi:hypothetical protein